MNYQKPKARPHFYTENGVVKLYRYCSLCSAGPFKEHDATLEKLGGEKTPVNYCPTCKTILETHKYGLKKSPYSQHEDSEKVVVPKKLKETVALDELLSALDPNDGIAQTFVFVARGKDDSLFCVDSDNPEETIANINNGSIKQTGIPKTALPMQLVYKKAVSITDSIDFVRKIRELPKVKKNELISAYQEKQ
jgi:predicted GIY-YIG superfamily endonuclease